MSSLSWPRRANKVDDPLGMTGPSHMRPVLVLAHNQAGSSETTSVYSEGTTTPTRGARAACGPALLTVTDTNVARFATGGPINATCTPRSIDRAAGMVVVVVVVAAMVVVVVASTVVVVSGSVVLVVATVITRDAADEVEVVAVVVGVTVVVVGANVVTGADVVVGAVAGRDAVVEAVTAAANTTADAGGWCRFLLKAATEPTTVKRATKKPTQRARGRCIRVRQVPIKAATYRFPDGAGVGSR